MIQVYRPGTYNAVHDTDVPIHVLTRIPNYQVQIVPLTRRYNLTRPWSHESWAAAAD